MFARTNAPDRQRESHPGRRNSSHGHSGRQVPAKNLLRLQQMIGNQAVLELIRTGRLKTNPMPPEVRAFVDAVRGHPDRYERLLLTIAFHPNPYQAFVDSLAGAHAFTLQAIQEARDPSAVVQEAVEELARIGQAYQRRNPGFARRIQSESQLRAAVEQAVNRVSSARLEPYLIDALLVSDEGQLWGVGLNLAQQELPARLARQAFESGAPQSLYAALGASLRQLAEERQRTDAGFRRRVEDERRRREQQRRERPRRPGTERMPGRVELA